MVAKYHLSDRRKVIIQGYVTEPTFVIGSENKACRIMNLNASGTFYFIKDENGNLFTISIEDEV